MTDFECPGLPANWLNGWLAAVGITVLDARVRLRWSADDTPIAVLSAAVDPIEAIVDSWPDANLLRDMPIAKSWRQAEKLGRHVQPDVFRERARMVRHHQHSWTLSSTLTDLSINREGVEHAPFDPPAPQGLTLHDRLMKLHGLLRRDVLGRRVLDSLTGQGNREQVNGLGFDHARVGSLADDTSPWVDPVVEILAFFGLAILPTRATGTLGVLQRGWRRERADSRARYFTWPAWTQPLDRLGVDALLDIWRPDPSRKQTWPLLGIHNGWRTIEYEARGKSDRTRAYGTERL